MNLREDKLKKGALKPTTDAKIWKYEVKSQIADLTVSLEKCNEIVKVLEELQTATARTSDNLKAVLLKVQDNLSE